MVYGIHGAWLISVSEPDLVINSANPEQQALRVLIFPEGTVSDAGSVGAEGGHFAALEQPQLFMEDLEAFAAVAWKCASGAK
ncbi:predicted protein [Histoplasma mississippiense (nom. inval.)]|uniref:predicted protein n=1 Tax=Ajellomyces capsulatus (strain NAm1 / WU24) TaxID=2059318 RepID=UPI000157B42F|nr:predicted protein [Histoplasma mississippiense (nom. inval.)]EDN02318.1 predicted protein [Histoplasma mississippiense (nom. inval.)]